MSERDHTDVIVMIVDDEKETRTIIRSILNDIGIKDIVESVDAKSAYHVIHYAYNKIDMILCDWKLPGRSGIEFLKQLQKEGRDIPFFVISGRDDEKSVAIAKNSGVTGYIRKPFTPEQLETHIRPALHRILDAKACEK